MNTAAHPPQRDGYHHGDLNNALVEAAVELARAGGPEAIVLREAARRVGVSATASYRHFASHRDLLVAVKGRAQDALAVEILEVLEQCDAEAGQGADPRRLAMARMRVTGRAYLAFAFNEPGLFNTAFCREKEAYHDQKLLGHADAAPFILLGKLLDDMVAAGAMTAERRHLAEIVAWAPVHGLAVLLTDGPLRGIPDDEREAAVEAVLDGVAYALVSPPVEIR